MAAAATVPTGATVAPPATVLPTTATATTTTTTTSTVANAGSSTPNSPPEAYRRARHLVDEAHRKDPSRSTLDASKPAELAYADSVESWAERLLQDDFYRRPSDEADGGDGVASGFRGSRELLLLAARCQHLERFLHPRSEYPEGKAAYLQWRRRLYAVQSQRAVELLREAGVGERERERVRTWVGKEELRPGKEHEGDLGTKLLEDAAVMVFLEEQLEGFTDQHAHEYSRDKFVEILRKTWRKLSPAGKRAAATLAMPHELAAIMDEATTTKDK